MTGVRLLAKDLRLLMRAPVLLAVLVGYPLLVSLLVAAALQAEGHRPALAVVDRDAPGRSVQVGDRRLTVDDYVARLAAEVEVRRLGPEAARRELEAGRVAAVLTVPEGFIGDLQSGVRPPTLSLVTSSRSPIEGQAITRRLEAAVFRFNQGLATAYVRQVLRLTDFILNGGSIGVFGRQGDVIGMGRSRAIIVGIQRDLRRSGRTGDAAQLEPILDFIDETRANLDLVRPAASAIASPIRLQTAAGAPGREPLSAFGVAAAVLVSVALAAGLLGASGIAAEREEGTLARLRRGLVPLPALVAVKMAVAALASLVIGLVLVGAVAVLTDLEVGRWPVWPPALLIAGAAFGGFGALIGAAARETRSALLATLMLSVPLLFVGLIPNRVLDPVSGVVPFGPAFQVFRALLAESSPGGGVAGDLGALAVMAVVLGGASTLLLRRRTGP